MAKYIVTQDEPTWLRTRYEVEADSEDEAREMVNEGQYEYLGYEVHDRVEPVDNHEVSVEHVDDPPKIRKEDQQDDNRPRRPDHWASLPEFPVEDWKYEVANDDTRLGYLAWVENQQDMNKEDSK